MANRVSGIVTAPVFDSDGVTLLAGTNYLAQMFANGAPVGTPVGFRIGAAAGYLLPSDLVVLDNVNPGTGVSAQIGVWEGEFGETYEKAIAAGSKFGISKSVHVIAGDVASPGVLAGLETFRLGDGPPRLRLRVKNVIASEGFGTRPATFMIDLTPPSTQSVSVDYLTQDQSAASGSDYVAASGKLTFAPGEVSKTVSVPVLEDQLHESDEVFLLKLSSPVNAIIVPGNEGTATIRDDDPLPEIRAENVTVSEGTPNPSKALLLLSLSASSSQAVTVDYATADGTALAGSDYTAVSGTLRFEPGETQKTIEVPILSDAVDEPTETFLVTFSNGANATLLRNSVTITITGSSIPPAGGGSAGTLDTSFDPGSGIAYSRGGINAWLETIVVQPDGRILIAGWFDTINGVSSPNLARLNADGTVDTSFVFSPGSSGGFIRGMAVDSQGRIVIGRLAGAGSVIMRLNPDGSRDSTFSEGRSDNWIQSLVLQPDGKTLFGGQFTFFNGVSRPGIARLLSDGSLDTSFNPGTGVTGSFSPSVEAITMLAEDKILIGGRFTNYNGTARGGLARLNPDGRLDIGFTPDAPFTVVSALALTSNAQPVVGGLGLSSVVRLLSNGPSDSTFKGLFGSIWVRAAVPQSDGNIIIGGETNTFIGTTIVRKGLFARLKADGSLDTTFNAGLGPDSSVYAVALQPDRQILVGGGFTNFNGVVRRGIARLNGAGKPQALAPAITAQPSDQVGLVGTTVTFSASVSGTAPIHFQWRKNGSDIDGGATSQTLTLANLQLSAAGGYSLFASNSVGSVTSRVATLTVTAPEPPKIAQAPLSQTVEPNTDVTLSVIATGAAPLTYQWFFNGTPITSATSATLVLPKVQTVQSGQYTVRVSNTAGVIESAPATVTVREIPPPPGIEPKLVAEWPGYLRGGPVTLKVRDRYAFVAAREAGLLTVDLIDPIHPQVIGSTGPGTQAEEVVLRGDHAFVINSGFFINAADVKDPKAPQWVSRYRTGGNAQSLVIQGDDLFVACGSAGLQIVRYDNLTAPSLTGSYDTGGKAQAVAVNGSYVYVLDENNGFYAFNVGDLSKPLGRYQGGLGFGLRYMAVVGGEYVYVTGYPTERFIPALAIFSGLPPVPALLAGTRIEFAGGVRISAIGNKAYMGGFPGFLVLDTTAPRNPVLIGSPEGYGGFPTDFQQQGHYLYVAGNARLDVFDLEGSTLPKLVGGVVIDGATVRMTVEGQRAYLSDQQGGLNIIDVSDTGSPKRIANFDKSNAKAVAVSANANRAFVAESTNGLTGKLIVLDLKAPGGLATVTSAPIRLSPSDIAVKDGYVYVVSDVLLSVFDVRNDTRADLIQEYRLSGSGTRIRIERQTAYVAASGGGLEVLDLADPSHPTHVATVQKTATVEGIAISNGIAFVAAGREGLVTIDIHDPSNPILLGSIDTPGMALDVVLIGDYAVVADESEGVQIINVANPAKLLRTGGYKTRGKAVTLSVKGSLVYVGQDKWGIAILDLGSSDSGIEPKITQQPISQRVLAGQTATLQVGVSGPGAFSYQWRRDGVDVPGATSATMTIAAASQTDAGEYSVVAILGNLRVLSEPARLDVVVPPAILAGPAAQTIVARSGVPLVLEISTSGTDPLGYQWLKDGVEVANATGPRFEKTAPTVADSGNYSVQVSNAAGTTTSASVPVRVLESVQVSRSPASQQSTLGARVEFTVEAGGSSPFTYQWRHNGQNIPGANGPTLVINPMTLADAGIYTVVIVNEAGATTSEPADLIIRLPSLPPRDNFADRVALPAEAAGAITTTNRLATREASEPLHAGKPGTHSVWFTWTAPASGRMSVDTIGSDFDTLLAVYTGTQLNGLTEIVSDDDHGGFFTSEVLFNAIAGTVYVIAVDGLGEAAGRLVLSWRLDVGAPLVPVITEQPASGTMQAGASLTLHVRADNAQSLQWRFNGSALAGAVGPDLTFASVTLAQVGTYEVAVTGGGVTILSRQAVVEIGDDPAARSYDKLEELLGLVQGPVVGLQRVEPSLLLTPSLSPSDGERVTDGRERGKSAAVGALPALAVSAGLPRTQIIDNTTATTQQREVNHCGTVGYHSRWLAVKPEKGGVLAVDTPGVAFPVVLALYGSGRLGDPALACAVGQPLRYEDAAASKTYYLAVDGLNGATGKIAVEVRLGQAPVAQTARAAHQELPLGRSTKLSASLPAIEGPPPHFQWLQNGVPIAGATGSEFEVPAAGVSDEGIYSVVIDNGIGRVTNEVARIAVDVPLALGGSAAEDAPRIEGDDFVFGFRGNSGQQVAVERSDNLTTWDTRAFSWLSKEGQGQHRESGVRSVLARMYRVGKVDLRLESTGEVMKGGARHNGWRVTGGRLGQRYVIEQSSNAGVTWTELRTNVVQTGDYHFEVPASQNLIQRVRLLENE